MLFEEIIGNLGSDPEQRYTADGKPVVSVRVAVNSRRKDANGDQVERTDWFHARMGGGRGDYVTRELRKGSQVLVRGRLEIGGWTTREGEQRTTYDIWAGDVINLTRRDGAPREDSPRAESDWYQAVIEPRDLAVSPLSRLQVGRHLPPVAPLGRVHRGRGC